MQSARIYQRVKNAMQSGRFQTDSWILEFEPKQKQHADSLTGWAGGGDVSDQVRLTFPTVDAAKAYAEKHGYAYHVVPAPERTLKLQAYADNFR